MLYAQGVGLAKVVPYPLTRSHPGKTYSYEPKAQNETLLPMRRKKSLTISHTQHSTTPISTHFNQRERMGTWEKKKRPTTGARKSKQRKKTGRKLKEKILIKLK